MNKGNILIISIVVLIVLAGVWYFAEKEITQNSFQPVDSGYDFGIQ